MDRVARRAERAARFAKVRPQVSASLRKKSVSDDNLEKAISGLASSLAKVDHPGRIVLSIKGGRLRQRVISLSGAGTTISKKRPSSQELEITMSRDDWWDVLRGNRSPLDVLVHGRLEFLGQCELARKVYRAVASKGATALSGERM